MQIPEHTVPEIVPQVDLAAMTKKAQQNPPEIMDIPLSKIRPMKGQPRTYVDMVKVREVADSIAEVGQSQPGKVKPIDPPDAEGHEWELISGERRYRACLMANVGFFRAEIDRTPMTEQEQFIKAVSCNNDQEPLSPAENAVAIDKLKKMGLKDADICKVFSKSLAWVSQRHQLLKLTPDVFKLLRPEIPVDDRMKMDVALTLAPLQAEYQIALANDIMARGLSSIQAKRLIEQTLRSQGMKLQKREPARQFKSFALYVVRTKEQLEGYLNLPSQELRTMLTGASNLQERMRTLEILDEIAAEMPTLQDEVAHILKLSGVDDVTRVREEAAVIKGLIGLAKDFPNLSQKLANVLRNREAAAQKAS